jgi:hypothetical protein
MDVLDRDHVVPPPVTSRNNRRAVFSVRGWCRRFITDMAHHLLGLGMWRLGDWKTYVCHSAVCVQLKSELELVQCGSER